MSKNKSISTLQKPRTGFGAGSKRINYYQVEVDLNFKEKIEQEKKKLARLVASPSPRRQATGTYRPGASRIAGLQSQEKEGGNLKYLDNLRRKYVNRPGSPTVESMSHKSGPSGKEPVKDLPKESARDVGMDGGKDPAKDQAKQPASRIKVFGGD